MRRFEADQEMDMVFDTANLKRYSIQTFDRASQVLMEPRSP